MFRMRHYAFLLFAVLFCLPATVAGAQAYTSIVVFGDSLCDTGNDALLSATANTVNAQVPGPATNYTNGRFTDGTDTLPAAHNYTGVWIEQLAAKLAAKPVINYSLNGGQNYAYGFATTNTGTTLFTYGPGNVLSFTVNNMATQVASYLATNPVINNKTLFVVWGGANDLIAATTAADIQNAAMRDAGLVQTLINAGATDFIIPNLPPLGLVPRFNGSTATSVPATAEAAAFDQALAAYLAALPAANPAKTLHLYPLDTYTLFSTIVAAPAVKGFANVTASAQGVTTVNPDTYLFWDNLHPTTYGHNLLAASALTLLGTPITTSTVLNTSNTQPNPGANFTLTAQVSGTSGTPMGTVTFLDGTTVLGSAVVTGATATATTATATLTTSYPTAGQHSLTATFTGANGYSSSTTTGPTPILVVAPTVLSTLNVTSLMIADGGTGGDALFLTPEGGFTGTVTLACGALPAHFTCSITPSSIALPGNNAGVSAIVTVGTMTSASLLRPSGLGGRRGQELILTCGLLPGFGLLGLATLRRKRTMLQRAALTGLFVFFAGVASLGLTGCSGNGSSNLAARGTYTVPVTVTAGGTVTTLNISVSVL